MISTSPRSPRRAFYAPTLPAPGIVAKHKPIICRFCAGVFEATGLPWPARDTPFRS